MAARAVLYCLIAHSCCVLHSSKVFSQTLKTFIPNLNMFMDRFCIRIFRFKYNNELIYNFLWVDVMPQLQEGGW